MRTEICLHLVHFLVLSSSALIPDTNKEEFFCFRTKSEIGHSQCTFLRRPSAVAPVIFYWTTWTADRRVEQCSISTEPALIQNYITVCQGTWDLHKMSSLRLNITLLLDPGSPCEFREIALGHLKSHMHLNPVYQMDSGFRMRQKRSWILPGTLWCGHGSRAGDYEQLGMFERVDRCCREHDHCDHVIRPFTVNFGVFNPTPFTISHCNCDHRFKQCLLDINDTVSNMVSYTFFSLLNLHCFELIQKRRCTKMNWIGMCTSDRVAPYAILKHTTIYNATTSNIGISKPRVCSQKPSATTKVKSMKPKERKQCTCEKSQVQRGLTRRPYSTPKNISLMSTIAQPNCLKNCKTALFHRKSKLIQQGTPFSAAAITANKHTRSSKQMTTPSKTIKPKKGRNITQWSSTTVQTRLNKSYNPSKMIPEQNGSPSRTDHFQPKQQMGNSHVTVAPKSFSLSLANKNLRTNKFFKSISQTKMETNSSSSKIPFYGLSSRSQPHNTSISKVKDKSAESIKHSWTWNDTFSTYETFKQTAICDITRELDDCKYRIRPMEKLFGHHNTETTTIYHCNCIQRLTAYLKQMERNALLEKLIWKFVSPSCIKIPNTMECSINKRCSATLRIDKEFESSLIILDGQTKKRKMSTKRRFSNQLYKHCLRILHPRRPKQV